MKVDAMQCYMESLGLGPCVDGDERPATHAFAFDCPHQIDHATRFKLLPDLAQMSGVQFHTAVLE